MKFSEMVYERPEYETVRAQYEELLTELEKAADKDTFLSVFRKIEALKAHLETMTVLASVRHTINTEDPFYDRENDYWDEHNPLYEVYMNRLAKIALACPFREELYDVIPKTWFQLAECREKSFSEEIVPLLQKENRLISEYNKLKATARIEFEGKTYNLASILSRMQDPDRSVRKGAGEAKMRFYTAHEADFDRIYDDLVHVRTEIAKALGYATFTELAYQRMMRLDYDKDMVARYRRQILEDIVPAADRLWARQAKRLGTETVAWFDENMEFPSGNPLPKGTYEELIAAAGTMYHEMSEETGVFIDQMIGNELWDLVSRDGKQMGGYCTSVTEYGVPFIFANFNGTSGDVDVLTHEAGHAFQYWCSRSIPVSDLRWPTMESAEIASMSMEFFAWPWSHLFFREDTDKYHFLHLAGTLTFLPYGVLVDHFQHEVYEHPEWTPKERNACWRKLELMYRPQIDYSGMPLLENGGRWYQQGHIFEVPFYYIDYTLAQVCALQFWARKQNNDPNVWEDYLELCRCGGTRPFTDLVRHVHLKVPFEEGCLKETAAAANAWLDSVDDTAF